MKIFKFGGASIKDVDSIKNLAKILQYEGVENTLIVVSAMGKMTNAFEKIVTAYVEDSNSLPQKLQFIHKYHFNIIDKLFINKTTIVSELNFLFGQLSSFMIQNKSKDYDFIYDQIVSFGELFSTKIISAFLNETGFDNTWLDVRAFIITDATHRDAKVDWEATKKQISTNVETSKLNITQGFLGGNENITTTLGREGSDFSAAIFAYCLNAKSVTIWKDVDGVLNADPRYFNNTILLDQISYKEAIEMAFYGASVIHPKTLKPLENKLIPLKVRSFKNLNYKGTVVQKGADLVPKIPCFIQKKEQILVSISALDFSFMVAHHISDIFNELHNHKLKVNLIQNSALSFSMCLEDKFKMFHVFYNTIKSKYKVIYNDDVTLFTIRHFDKKSIKRIKRDNEVLLQQISRETIQIVIK